MNEESVGAISEHNPVFKNKHLTKEDEFNESMAIVKWTTVAIVAPLLFCIGIMVGVHIDTFNEPTQMEGRK